jgi:hypothetical protein
MSPNKAGAAQPVYIQDRSDAAATLSVIQALHKQKSSLGRYFATTERFAGGRISEGPDWGVKVQNQRIKWQAGLIAASAVVSLAALAAAIDQEQTATAQSGNMSVGETTTSTTPPMGPPTAVARPIMKAQRPRGY